MKKKLLAVLTAMVIISCSDDVIKHQTGVSETNISSLTKVYKNKNDLENAKLVAFTGKTVIPMQEIKDLAMHTATKMRAVEGIVTKTSLRFKSLQVVKGNKKEPYIQTKGVDKNTDMVLINFENNQGYVLISADRRVPVVFAYSSTGNLSDGNNPGEQVLLSRIPSYMKLKRAEFEKNKSELKKLKEEDFFKKIGKQKQQELINSGLFDQDGKRIVSKSGDVDLRGVLELPGDDTVLKRCSVRVVKKQAPLMKTVWHQYDQYNDLLETPNCDTPVGCVAVAVGQIMAYHKKPVMFKGKKMNWGKMTEVSPGKMFSEIESISDNQAKDNIRHLLARLGDDDLLHMNYSCETSGANSLNAINVFQKYGYTASDMTVKYDSDKVADEVFVHKRPVFVRGNSFETYHPGTEYLVTYEGGHAWVIDGYVKNVFIGKDCEDTSSAGFYHESELFHNNFGWGGSLKGDAVFDDDADVGIGRATTGWYLKGLFDSNNGPHDGSNTYKSNETTSGEDNNYKFNNEMIIIK